MNLVKQIKNLKLYQLNDNTYEIYEKDKLIIKTYSEAKLNVEHAIEELETLARCNCIFL